MAESILVGILNDMSEGPDAQSTVEPLLQLCADDMRSAGRLDRDVEFVNAWGLGLPSGTAAAVERAFADLVELDVLLIAGPAIGDNALIATPLADRYHIPTINWAGTEKARSEHMFHLQVGSHEDESLVIARHLAGLGVARVSVVRDRSPIGLRYFQFLQEEAELLGIRIVALSTVAPLAEDTAAEVAEALDANPDALVYLGLGLSAPAVARAGRERNWDGPSVMNTAGLRGYEPAFAEAIDGWTYIDMIADDNSTLAALRERIRLPAGAELGAAYGYDMGRLVAEALARAPELTRDGVREGLEKVKWLPAAQGHEGTQLGFGKHDRGALHGRYLVLRRWQGGRSEQV